MIVESMQRLGLHIDPNHPNMDHPINMHAIWKSTSKPIDRGKFGSCWGGLDMNIVFNRRDSWHNFSVGGSDGLWAQLIR